MIESMVFLVSCNILWFLFICTYSFNKYLLSKARSTAINKITSLSFWSSSHWESQTADSCVKCVWIYLRRALKENEAVHNIGKSLVREHLIDRIFEQRRERVMPVSGGEHLALVMCGSARRQRGKRASEVGLRSTWLLKQGFVGAYSEGYILFYLVI